MRKMTHPFFHKASILVSVGVFLTHRFETAGVFAHFLCVKNTKTPSIWSSGYHFFFSEKRQGLFIRAGTFTMINMVNNLRIYHIIH